MDDIDQRIVALLRENARRSFQDIGARVALSAPAVKRRVDRLEADGVIRAYAAVLEPGAMGWPTHAVVALYCEGRMAAKDVRDAVAPHPEVSAAFTVAGEAPATPPTSSRRSNASATPPESSARRRRSCCRHCSNARSADSRRSASGDVGDEADGAGGRARRQEPEQPLALRRDRLDAARRVAGPRDEAVDRQRRLVAVLGDLPVRAVEAVDEQRPDRPAAARQRRARPEPGEQARAVGVREADVVVLG